ncbi:hypothetical protein H8E88_03130 [candidate division KSB1 bacterium]|nr:hypothetical protein [candidate division KSB1 bacterium]
MKKPENRNHVKITGYVTSTDRDKQGNVVQVAIETEDFVRYVIAENQVARKLFDFINKKVKVNGFISGQYLDGREIIFINNYEVIK